MIPRFVNAVETVDLVNNYLEGMGRIVRIITSDVIHKQVSYNNVQIYLFTSLNAATLHNIDIKGALTMLILEWGFEQEMYAKFLERYRGKVKVLKLAFLHDPRIINVNPFHVPMSTDYGAWYKAFTEHIDASVEIRSMVGNHFYRDAPPEEIKRSMVDPKSYNYESDDDIGASNHEQVKAHARTVNNNDLITHPAELEGGRHYKSSDTTIKGDSPKIFTIAQTYIKAPGKYLILTSYRFIFGTIIISKMIKKILGMTPMVIDPIMDKSKIDDIYTKFSELKEGVLITSIIPKSGLKDIDRIIVMDNYNINFIINAIKSVCNYRCGTIDKPLEVTLLSVSYPSYIKETTREERQSKIAVDILSEKEEDYRGLSKIAIPVVLKDTDWEVKDSKVEYF
jgi:hypothetical protein